MAQATNNLVKCSKGGWLTVGFLFVLAVCPQVFAAPVSYTYDNLSRLTEANYNNGQQVITYTYDAAGNMLSRTTTNAEQLPPTLTIASPLNGTVTSSATITVAGTATDAGQGDSGIASVTVNMLPADNGTATGTGTANWSLNLGLAIGTNNFTVIATDGSPSANQTTDNVTVVYLPLIADVDADGLPDVWETANSVSDPGGDPDLDGVTTLEEYKASTDPQSNLSKPEGAGGVNYVLLRDHFDDDQYDDRWYLAALDPDASYTLNEAGTEIQATVQRPAAACSRLQYESFATVDAVDAVYHATLQLDGFGNTALGLMQDQDPDNRLEVVFDNDTDPYLTIRSFDAGVLNAIPVTLPGPYQGATVDLRIAKTGSQYAVYVDYVNRASVNNNGLGDLALRPYVVADSCLDNTGFLDSKIDLIEMLFDRDADGRADTHEDANANGVVDANESDPLNPDMDSDTVLDGYDNCLFAGNVGQRDTDGDSYGNFCDADFDNNNAVNFADLGYMKSVFFTADADADLNGDGAVNFADLGRLKSIFFKPPGPSGLMP